MLYWISYSSLRINWLLSMLGIALLIQMNCFLRSAHLATWLWCSCRWTFEPVSPPLESGFDLLLLALAIRTWQKWLGAHSRRRTQDPTGFHSLWWNSASKLGEANPRRDNFRPAIALPTYQLSTWAGCVNTAMLDSEHKECIANS